MENQILLIIVTIFYLIFFIGGVMGNILVFIVIIRSKNLQSAMNYYLLSLAFADLTLITFGKYSNYYLFFFKKNCIVFQVCRMS